MNHFSLFFNPGFGAVKLHEQGVLLRITQLGVGVENAHLLIIHQLDARDGNPQLNG